MTNHAKADSAVVRSPVAKVKLDIQLNNNVTDNAVQPDQDRTQVAIYGYPLGSSAPKLFDVFFPGMELPRFRYISRDTKEVDTEDSAWRRDILQPWCLGTVVTMPLKLAVMPYLDELTPEALAIGCVNTTFFTAEGKHVGTNTDQIGIANAILTVANGMPTPFAEGTPTAWREGAGAGLLVGSGGAGRAAIQGMLNLGLSPIYIVNRDQIETAGVVTQFPSANIIPVETVEDAQHVLKALDEQQKSIYAGVGAIPPFEAETDAEKNVYLVAAKMLAYPYTSKRFQESLQDGYCRAPDKPIFCEMPYKPRMTRMRQLAEDSGWHTVCGVEVALEGCFEQFRIWTEKSVTPEIREAGRLLLRSQ